MRISVLSLLLPAFLSCSFAAQAQTTNGSALKQPDQITTVDGRTYHHISIVGVQPDGLVISYKPSQPGIGMAMLKFADLPASLQTKYGYDAAKASAFEKAQDQARTKWRQQQSAQQASVERYRAMAELNRALGGEDLSSYSVSLDGQGNVTAHGFTGNVLPYAWYCPRGWWWDGGTVQPHSANGSLLKAPRGSGARY